MEDSLIPTEDEVMAKWVEWGAEAIRKEIDAKILANLLNRVHGMVQLGLFDD